MKNKSAFPKYLSIQTTSLCNASCIFCPSTDIKELFPARVMDMALYRKIIDECRNHKNTERIILYMNNEPLTDPLLIDRINYAKETIPWASVHILTNGLLLTGEMAQRLIDSKLDWIGISFHGLKKETIEKSMGIPYETAFQRVNNFIKRAKGKKNIEDYIMITFLRHKYLSLAEKEEAIGYWKKRGVSRISYFDSPISRAGNVRGMPKISRRGRITGCGSIWADEMIHVVEDGKIILCCMDWRREVILGDVNRERIFDIWNGRREDIWQMIYGKNEMPSDFLCRRCEEVESAPEVLLVQCPPWGIDTPPLGIASLTSFLKARNIETTAYDLNIKLYNAVAECHKHLWSMNYSNLWRDEEEFLKIEKYLRPYLDDFIREIIDSPCKIIGFSLPTNCADLFLEKVLIKIKKGDPSKIIILGGVSVNITQQRHSLLERIKDNVDYCVIGEGEEVLYKLIKSIKNKEDTSGIEGVLDKETFFDKRDPVYVESLDNLPIPEFRGFNLNEYKTHNSLLMEFSRGCIGQCTFCAFKSISPRFRSKSSQYIFNQIKFYIERYGVTHLLVCDSALNGNMKTLGQLCDLLIGDNLAVKISGLAIPRKEMTKDFLKKMKDAGFYRLEYGVESGSNKVLKSMRKIFTKETAQQVLRDTHEAGVETWLYLMVGHPGEGEAELNETKEFLLENAPYITALRSVNPLYLICGSLLQRDYKKYNIKLPERGDADRRWYIENENTYDIRRDRVREIKALARKAGIPFTEEAESLEFTLGFLNEKNEPNASNKKSDLLLVNLPPWGQDNPHIGVAYLGSYLRARGLKMDVLDLNKRFNLNNTEFKMLWHVENKNFWSREETFPLILEIFKDDIDNAIGEVLSYDCSILGFSVVDPKERLTIEFIKRIKEKSPNKKIILGGPATSTAEQRKIFLYEKEDLIDAFVLGEGEETLFYLLDRLLNKGKIEGMEGCCIRDSGKWLCRDRPPISPLNSIPFPTYEEFDLDLYGKSLLIEWSRGCRARCAFCKNYRLFPGYRLKSADWIMNEIQHHKGRYNITEFTVVDNILNGDLKLLNEVCSRLKKEKLAVRWTGQMTPHKEMGSDFFKKMKDAGCFRLQIGLESGSTNVLRLMRKTFIPETSEANIRSAKKAGIETEIFIMVGFPGETERDFNKTYDFIKRNAAYIDAIKSINTPHLIAGTEIYERADDKFNMKPLPKTDYHYLWETYDGNTYAVRKERVHRLLDLSSDMGIKVMETNIHEGKENLLDIIKDKNRTDEKISVLFDSINSIQELPGRKRTTKKRRAMFKWLLLAVVSFYTLCYIAYFWVYMHMRGKILLGGKVPFKKRRGIWAR